MPIRDEHCYEHYLLSSANIYCFLQVLTADGDTQVGEIRKQWSGLVREAFTDADNFGVTFPVDMHVHTKVNQHPILSD